MRNKIDFNLQLVMPLFTDFSKRDHFNTSIKVMRSKRQVRHAISHAEVYPTAGGQSGRYTVKKE